MDLWNSAATVFPRRTACSCSKFLQQVTSQFLYFGGQVPIHPLKLVKNSFQEVCTKVVFVGNSSNL